MTIQRIHIENFQSHKDTEIELSDGMNVVFGPSDNGKSSIIRALRWVILNRPVGDSFRRHDTKKTQVTVETDNFIVQRRKTDSKNEYEMDENVYKALRSSVPEDISVSLNLSEVNIQSQHEVYFLIDKSPGQRSKILNEVAGLEIMDKVLQNTNSKIRSVNQEIKSSNDSLREIQTEILETEWAKKANIQLKHIEEYKNKIDSKKENLDNIKSIIEDLEILEKQKSLFISDECISKLNYLNKYNNGIEKKKEQYRVLNSIILSILEAQNNIDEIVVIDTSALEKLNNDISSAKDRYDRMLDLIEEIEFKHEQHVKLNFEIIKSEKNVEMELKRLGVCPICGAKI